MDYWSILGIEVTDDITAIKKAYAKKLRKYHPEDDPEGFQRVREAYEAALKMAKLSKSSMPVGAEQKAEHDEEHYKEYDEESDKQHWENTEKKVIIQDTYTIDLKSIQKDLDIEEQNASKTEEQSENRARRKLEPIYNFKKPTPESEFMNKVKAIYNDGSTRNDREKWKALLNELAFCTIDTNEKIYCLLYDFLQENHKMSYKILVLLNEHFKWARKPEELVGIFFEDKELLDLARFEQDIGITRMVIRILYNKAESLREKSVTRYQAVHIYTQIIDFAKANIDTDIDRCLVYALYNKADILAQANNHNDYAMVNYDKLIEYYGERQELEMRRLVAEALFRKARLLIRKCEYVEAIYFYSKLIRKYLKDTDEEITLLVASAQYNKAMYLVFLEKYSEGFDILKDITEMYSFHKNKEVRAIAKRAMLSIKDTLWERLALKSALVLLMLMFLSAMFGLEIVFGCAGIVIILMIIFKTCRVYIKHKYKM